MDLKKVKDELFNEVTGIINSISTLEYPVGALSLYSIVVKGNPVVDYKLNKIIDCKYTGLGYDFDSYEIAERKAIGEFIERYASTVSNKKKISGTYMELKNSKLNFMNPLTITRVNEKQLLQYGKKGLCLSENTNFYWVEGMDEINGIPTWIPTDIIYLLPNFKNEFPIRDITSTGLATGNSLLKAKIRGLLECIERDAFVIMWLNKISYPRVKLDTILNLNIIKKIKEIKNQGLEIIVVDISNDINIPIYCTFIKNDTYPYLSVGASANFDEESALLGSIREAVTTFNLNVNRSFNLIKKTSTDFNIFEFKSMDDHSSIYADININSELDFLEQGDEINFSANKKRIKDFDELLNCMKLLNLDYYSVDLTTKDLKNTNLFVVRSISPQLAFLELGLPMLNCLRIKNVPKKMKYKRSATLNKIPHPFP